MIARIVAYISFGLALLRVRIFALFIAVVIRTFALKILEAKNYQSHGKRGAPDL